MSGIRGHLSLRAEAHPGGRTVIDEQSFSAPFHLSKPYWDGRVLIVQVVNPTAGVLSGDGLRSNIGVGRDAALLVTTPSATRVFQASGAPAQSEQRFAVSDGGWLDYLPEPLVPHRGSQFFQSTTIEASAHAELFYADLVMPGRLGRGEAWSWDRLVLALRLSVGGDLLLCERWDQSGAEAKGLATLAGREAGACFANLVVVSPRLKEAGVWTERIRGLHREGCWVGVSALRGNRGGWSVKMIAEDSIGLRAALAEVRESLAAELPRLRSLPRKF